MIHVPLKGSCVSTKLHGIRLKGLNVTMLHSVKIVIIAAG